MGSDWGEFWRRLLRFSWFGHQSLFDVIPIFVAPCTTGHLPAFSSVFASMFPSDRVPVFFERLLEAPGMRLPGLGERLEPVGDLVEAFLAGHARHARIRVGVFVGLARDRGLEVVACRTDRLAGRRVAHFLEIFEMAVRVPGLALGSRAEHGGDIVEALDVGLLGEIEIAAVRQALAGKRVLQILLGLGSLERRHVPSSAWSEKPMVARAGGFGRPETATRSPGMSSSRPDDIFEKEVMMVTDVGVEIGVRAGKGILCTIAAVRHQRNQVVATLLK